MSLPYAALIQKEWIKLRYIIWIVPALLIYAAADTYFTLNTIERVHESFGLWATLVSKEPPLFASFQYIVFAGFLIAFFQVWPEAQGKHIRLLFHMPVPPAHMVGFMLGVGLVLIVGTNILAALVLLTTLWAFHLPWEIMSSMLCAFAPHAVLSVVSYMSVFAFCGTKKWGIRGLIVFTCLVFYTLLWGIGGYNLWREALHWYALLGASMIFLCFFSFLQVMGEPHKSRLYTVSRMVSLTLFGILFLVVLPQQYWRVYMPKSASQRLYYSPVYDQFVRDQTIFDANAVPPSQTISSLEDGSVLNKREVALALPTMHSENLLKWDMFPKEIKGKTLSLHQIKYDWQYLSLSPRTITKPPLMLEMMLESQPEGASIEAPVDMFRMRHDRAGIEFLRPEDGSIDIDKSADFTKALSTQGFVFPIRGMGGNPNIRKAYDAGYVLVDAKGHIFQLQMIKGKAHCAKVDGNIPEDIHSILVDENRREEFFAYIITKHKVYAVKHKPLSVLTLPLNDYDVEHSFFYTWMDPLQKTFVQGSHDNREAGITGGAYSPDLHLLREYTLPMRTEDVQRIDYYNTIAAVFFPWRVVQRSPASLYYDFDIQMTHNLFVSIVSNVLCVLLLVFLFKKRRKRPFDFFFVAVFGVSGLCILGIEALSGSRLRFF